MASNLPPTSFHFQTSHCVTSFLLSQENPSLEEGLFDQENVLTGHMGLWIWPQGTCLSNKLNEFQSRIVVALYHTCVWLRRVCKLKPGHTFLFQMDQVVGHRPGKENHHSYHGQMHMGSKNLGKSQTSGWPHWTNSAQPTGWCLPSVRAQMSATCHSSKWIKSTEKTCISKSLV